MTIDPRPNEGATQRSSASRPARQRRLLALAVGAVALLSYTVLSATQRQKAAMRCETFDRKTFEAALAAEREEPLYRAPDQMNHRWKAQFELSKFDGWTADHQLLLGSTRAGGVIYAGPFKTRIELNAGRELLTDQGNDAFRVVLVDARSHRICVAQQTDTFWRKDTWTVLELLPRRELDARGVPMSFRVTGRAG